MEENRWQTFECPTLPPGWTREVVARKRGKSAWKQSDVYYRSPNGKRVRSKPALIQRLGSQGNPVDLNMFEWRSGNMNPELLKPKAKRRRTNSKGSSSDMSSIEGEDSVPVEEKYLNVPSTPSSNTYPLPINMTHSKPLHNGTAPMKLPKNWKETLCPILKPSSPVKLSKDWREKLSTEKIFKPKANSPQPVKLAKDWKETSRSISSSISHGRLPTTHTPVKLSKDWKEKAGLKASTSIAHGSHEKLPKNWRERSKDMPIANVNAIHATKLPKNWKDLFDKQPRSSPKIISNSNSKQNSLVQGSTTSPVKLPKDWRKPEAGLGGWGGTRVRVEPTKLPKNWNQTVAVNKTPQVGERGENAQNYAKLSTDWNKNLALSRSAFAVKLPKGWMDEALEEQRLRRLERNQSTSEAHQRREHRHHADYALVLPSGWESLTPKELVDNLCSSDQARKLSSEVRENFERDLLSRLEEVEKDQLAVRLEKGWHKGLPPLPEVEDTQLPARLVLPRDWEERDAESLAEELGIALPPEEKVNILPETWATDLRKDGKAIKRRNNTAVIEGTAKEREFEDKSLHQSSVEEESKKGLCEYELIRQENIRQRDALFAKLGLEDAKASVATKGKNKSATGGSKPKKGKRRDDMEKNGKERSLKSKNGKSGSGRPEKEVTPAEKEQLEMPALQGWKREVVLSKVIKLKVPKLPLPPPPPSLLVLYHKAIQGCPRMDEDFNVVEGLDEVKQLALKSSPSKLISGYCGLLASLGGWRGPLVPQDNQPHAPSWCEEAADQKGGG